MKILTKDNVIVITGKDKGKQGVVKKIIKKKDKVIVEGINMITKHLKRKDGKSGQKIQIEAPIHVSNLMLICPKTKKSTRVKYVISELSDKKRVAVKSGEIISHKFKKTK